MISSGVFSSEQAAYTASYPATGTGLQPRATFSQAGGPSVTVDGFFDGLTNGTSGNAIFRIRFTPTTSSGTWNYSTISTDAGLQVTGSFTASTSTAKGFLRRDPNFPQKFIWDNGARPYLWGQTYYQIVNHARTNNTSLWHPSITGSAGYGMNKVRLLVSPWGPDPRYAGADSKAFKKNADGTLNRDRLDVDHWRALDKVVSFLHGQGIVADLILFHDGANTTNPYGTVTQNRRYTRYTVARYAAYTNVIWTLSNEYQLVTGSSPGPANDPWNDLGCLIRGNCNGYGAGADPWIVNGSAVRGLSNQNNINTTDFNRPTNGSYPCFEFFTAGWPGHISQQTKRGTTPDVEAFNAASRNTNLSHPNPCPGLTSATRLPFINDEYYYVGTIADPALDRTRHRLAVWATAVAGGYGSTGSLKGPSGCGGTCSPSLYTTWVDEPGHYGDVRAVTTFFNSVANWWRMSGNLSIPAQNRVYALSETDVQFVIYSAGGSSVTLNVPNPPAGRQGWSYCFVSPQSGICTDKVLRTTIGGGTKTFPLPDANDWAMHFLVY